MTIARIVLLAFLLESTLSHGCDTGSFGANMGSSSGSVSLEGALLSSLLMGITTTTLCLFQDNPKKFKKRGLSYFFEENENHLKLDVARGGGPYLAELMVKAQCSPNHSQIYKKLSEKYSEIYSSNNSREEIEKILKLNNCDLSSD